MTALFYLLATVALASISSHTFKENTNQGRVTISGVSSVGNGGGFAEMLALKADQTMASQLSSCLASPDLCPITPDGNKMARQLIESDPHLRSSLPLKFQPVCSSKATVEADSVQIPSCLLYTKDSGGQIQPRSLSEISLQVLAARGIQSGLDPDQLVAALGPAFQNFRLIDESSTLPFGESEIILHSVLFEKDWWARERSLILELPQESLELTDLLASQVCEAGKIHEFEVQILRSQMLDSGKFLFQGRIRWSCELFTSRIWQAGIFLTGVVTREGRLAENSTQVMIRQKERRW